MNGPALPGEGGRGDPLWIDGASGEGGGQILRTSLALAMITGRPLHMHRIRAGRAKPGLRRQHLACVEAAAQLCHAEVRGAAVGSQQLVFTPGEITGGELAIDIGSAGSTTLVVQTLLVPAIAARRPLRAVIRGGTHNPLAPPFEFLERVWLPHLRAMGAEVDVALDRHGFASGGEPPERSAGDGGRVRRGVRDGRAEGRDGDGRGVRDGRAEGREGDGRGVRDSRAERHDGDDRGGRDGRAAAARGASDGRSVQGDDERAGSAPVHGQLTLTVGAGGALRPIEVVEAGPITARRATAVLSRLPSHVAERELAVVRERLGFAGAECEVREVRGSGPANVLLLEVERAQGREIVSGFGEKRLRAEVVARRACDELAALLAAEVPVGEHLADQLLLPLAVAGGGRFRTSPLSLHATTNIETIRQFLDVAIDVASDDAAGAADRRSGSVIVAIGEPIG